MFSPKSEVFTREPIKTVVFCELDGILPRDLYPCNDWILLLIAAVKCYKRRHVHRIGTHAARRLPSCCAKAFARMAGSESALWPIFPPGPPRWSRAFARC